jgi:hypothetical protein
VAVLTDTPWPPAIRVWVASARGGESPTLGGGGEGRDARASAAKVCTSAARKTAGNPLHARGAKLLRAALAVAVAVASGVNRRRRRRGRRLAPSAVASCDCCFGGGEQDEDRVSLPASCPRLAVSKKEGCRGGNEAVTKLVARTKVIAGATPKRIKASQTGLVFRRAVSGEFLAAERRLICCRGMPSGPAR